MPKNLLRQRLLQGRRRLGSDSYRRKSAAVQSLLCAHDCFSGAVTVALYSPVNNEVDTGRVFAWSKELGKKVFYPRVEGLDLGFYEVPRRQDLVLGAFGVLEPAPAEGPARSGFDLVVVPGVAFDLRGHRLGYGKGYYDRWLSGKRGGILVGLAFDLQIVDELPAEKHDQQLDYIVTETRFIPCHNGMAGSI